MLMSCYGHSSKPTLCINVQPLSSANESQEQESPLSLNRCEHSFLTAALHIDRVTCASVLSLQDEAAFVPTHESSWTCCPETAATDMVDS